MIGVACPVFCSRPFPEMAEAIAEHFDMWEVLSEGMHCLDLVREELVRARDTLGLRFQVHAPMSDVNVGSVYEPMRTAAVDEVTHVMGLCRALDIDVVTVHPGFVNGIAFLDRPKALERTRVSVRRLAEVAEENGVVMALENLPANINATCTSAQDLLYVLEGTSASVCFDVGHANTSGEVDAMLRHVARFRNVHVHNNDGTWDQHNVIDQGTADVGKVVSALRGSYSGNIVIESTDLGTGVQSKAILERLLDPGPAPQAL